MMIFLNGIVIGVLVGIMIAVMYARLAVAGKADEQENRMIDRMIDEAIAKGMMNMKEAQYLIDTDESSPETLVIHDVGPYSVNPTVTNDAENVVRRLARGGYLTPGRRLVYYDSGGYLTELIVKDGCFAGFAPYNRKASPAATSEAMKK